MSTATPTSPPPSLGKLFLRRSLIALALLVMMLVPMIVLLVITGQPAATYSAMGTIIGIVAVLAGGLRIGVITVICWVVTIPDGVVLPQTGADWGSVVYMALVAGAAAMLAQTWAQAHLPPTRSAIIMSMEPVFAATFAVWLGGEAATARMLLGGLMVLTAMLLVEVAPRRKVEGEVQHLVV